MKRFAQKFDSGYCPGTILLELFANKWSLILLQHIGATGPARFNDLFRGIPRISEKVLAQTLDLLERDGLIDKRIYVEAPPHTEYTATPLGQTLLPLLDRLKTWCDDHREEILAHRGGWDRRHP